MGNNLEMRQVLANELEFLLENDEKVVLLDADLALANGTFRLREKFKDRAIDIGISEQHMASMAAGLSAYGYKPFICTFTAFASRRICDQIAISMAYAKQNVKIIATDSGISSQLNGGTHMSVEDIGVLRSIPNIVIFEPVDTTQLSKGLIQLADYDGIVYIRMVRKDTPKIFDDDYDFKLFEGDIIREGKDITIISTGIMTSEVIKASIILDDMGIAVEHINIHTIKPLDKDKIIASVKKTKCALVCENHNLIGGLYSAVCEAISGEYPVKVKGVGIQDHFGEVGKMPFLMEKYEMSAKHIVQRALEVIESK